MFHMPYLLGPGVVETLRAVKGNKMGTYIAARPLGVTFELVTQWADERNLIEGGTRQAQMLKMTEEVGELASGIARNNEELVKDSIGDCLVVLTILAAQSNLTIQQCLEAAYEEIKDRKGRMVDGVFVREA